MPLLALLMFAALNTPETVRAQASCTAALPAVQNGRFPASCVGAADGSVCTAICNARYVICLVKLTGGSHLHPHPQWFQAELSSETVSRECSGSVAYVLLIAGTRASQFPP